MRPRFDYHVHTTFSCDADATMEEQCRRAIEIGLEEVAFTEHLDLQPNDPCYGYYNREAYDAEFRRCQEQFAGKITLRRGVEVTYQQEFHDEIVNWLSTYPYDVVLGSVHVVKSEFLHLRDLYQRWSARDCYAWYYEELQRAAESGLFSSLGHLDLPKRYSFETYGPVAWTEHREAIEAVLKAAITSGTGIEINASGLYSAAAETFPGPEVVALYRQLGGEILTVGSDSHRTSNLGRGLEQALAIAKAAGFTHVATFDARQPHLIPIE